MFAGQPFKGYSPPKDSSTSDDQNFTAKPLNFKEQPPVMSRSPQIKMTRWPKGNAALRTKFRGGVRRPAAPILWAHVKNIFRTQCACKKQRPYGSATGWCGPGNIRGFVLGGNSYQKGWATIQTPFEPAVKSWGQQPYYRVGGIFQWMPRCKF